MTETVVHVTTLDQWKSVLDVWFKQGYEWNAGGKEYSESTFKFGGKYLFLDDYITCSMFNNYSGPYIEYSEFVAQQKENNKMATVYEVSQSVFDELQRIKAHEGISLIGAVILSSQFIKSIKIGNKAILRYLADDPAIEFKPKEQLYRLWRINDADNKVYMRFNHGTPDWTLYEESAFTAPLEEIKKWVTPAWSWEKAF